MKLYNFTKVWIFKIINNLLMNKKKSMEFHNQINNKLNCFYQKYKN